MVLVTGDDAGTGAVNAPKFCGRGTEVKQYFLAGTAGLAVTLLSSGMAQANGVAPLAEAPTAEKIKLGLGGFMEQWVGWVDENTGQYRSFEHKSESGISLSGSTVLSNGLTVEVVIGLLGDKGPGEIEESFLSISSDSFGTLILGSPATVTDEMHHGAPDVGIGVGDSRAWIIDSSAARAGTATDPGGQNAVQYLTPNWHGLQIGLEYGADPYECCQTRTQPLITSEDYFAGVITYNRAVGAFSIGVDAGAMIQNIPYRDDDREEYQFGVQLGYAGFVLGGGYFHGNHQGAWGEEQAWELGVSYGQDAWAVSASYVHGETDEAEDPILAPWGATHDDEFTGLLVSASYQLGEGVTLMGSAFYSEATDQRVISNEGMGLTGGIKVEF